MPYFLCRLAAEDGRVFDQTLLASTREECQKFFESEGLFVLSIKKDWKKIQIRVLPFEKRIKDRDFIMFNQELVALLKSGYPVLKGIEILSGRVKNVYFKEISGQGREFHPPGEIVIGGLFALRKQVF